MSEAFVSENPGRDVQRVGTARFLGEEPTKIHQPVWAVTGSLGDSQCYVGVTAKVAAVQEAMSERIRSSKIADLSQHDWVRWGGGLFAAAFLREFTAGIPWAHLDIAGPSFNSGGAWGHVTSGGTGVAVTTLVDFARTLAAAKA